VSSRRTPARAPQPNEKRDHHAHTQFHTQVPNQGDPEGRRGDHHRRRRVGGTRGVGVGRPHDAVNIDTASHTFQFGSDCLAGVAPTTDGKLNWNENAAHTTVRPHLTGTFCLQNSTAHARVALEYRDNSDALLSRFNSDIMSGSGSSLDTMDVDVEGYKVSSALVDHVHVQIQEEDSTGRWVNVPLGAEYLYYP
jgi:hypothetical protein